MLINCVYVTDPLAVDTHTTSNVPNEIVNFLQNHCPRRVPVDAEDHVILT